MAYDSFADTIFPLHISFRNHLVAYGSVAERRDRWTQVLSPFPRFPLPTNFVNHLVNKETDVAPMCHSLWFIEWRRPAARKTALNRAVGKRLTGTHPQNTFILFRTKVLYIQASLTFFTVNTPTSYHYVFRSYSLHSAIGHRLAMP